MTGTSYVARALKRGRLTLNRYGYDIHPLDCRCWDDQRALLAGLEDVVIFDVGANRGQTAVRYRSLFPASEIHCFEPQAELCEEIDHRFRGDSKVSAYSCAVGASDGSVNLYVNKKRDTSSLLKSD